MQRLLRPALAVLLTFTLGACATAATPSTVNSTAPAAPASTQPSTAPASEDGGGASAAAACAVAETGATATATVTIKSFTYSPDPITAKVGDVIGWSNEDSAGHTATLDDGTCTTDTIANGASGLLVFTAPGTYPYHCNIHPTQMKGTITING
jgi:plastocyanin